MLFFFRCFNLLSLDAVLIALVWQEMLARAGNSELQWKERITLGMTVWIIYIGDHLIDATNKMMPQAPRHRFIAKHRALFIFLLIGFLFIDGLMAFQLERSLLIVGGIMGIIIFSYLLINAWLMAHQRWLKGREIFVALIFSLGCGLVPIVESDHGKRLLPWLILFASVCAINTTLIARLERGTRWQFLLAPINEKSLHAITGALFFLTIVGYLYHLPSIAIALLISLLGLSLIPQVAKKWGSEIASLATDGALLLGGVLLLVNPHISY